MLSKRDMSKMHVGSRSMTLFRYAAIRDTGKKPHVRTHVSTDISTYEIVSSQAAYSWQTFLKYRRQFICQSRVHTSVSIGACGNELGDEGWTRRAVLTVHVCLFFARGLRGLCLMSTCLFLGVLATALFQVLHGCYVYWDNG